MNPAQPHVPLAEVIGYNYREFSVQRGFPDGSAGKECACNAGDIRDLNLILGWEDPLEGKWQPTPVFSPGKLHGQRSLEGYRPKGQKQWSIGELLSMSACSAHRIWQPYCTTQPPFLNNTACPCCQYRPSWLGSSLLLSSWKNLLTSDGNSTSNSTCWRFFVLKDISASIMIDDSDNMSYPPLYSPEATHYCHQHRSRPSSACSLELGTVKFGLERPVLS